ncbi:N-terminal domain of (some) glycogen debranching enzymes [Microlunatus sagamiharensis]|uniref:N-terminal domain of (Some) glycogen debranching enzymes n=1 Tax=Microlunatus sagamiharensis TaxID=546874 RepID=A0A1H2N4F7_9ACTN|nr:glycogen debranching N-terminal domain-containing protein [Microlunatus sagamiharensis]SDU99676.1 N-terminal domain of (some) glycogen debranching enzymes [Microlunatus sagamiharensis]
MPQPLEPFLHDLVGQVAAPTQAWSRRDGQVVPSADGAADVAGLVHADVVLLSGIEASVDGDPGVPVARRSRPDGREVFTSLLRRLDAEHADTGDPRVRLDRTRGVVPGRMEEELVVASTLDVDLRVRVEVALQPSGTPMGAVRQSRPVVPVEVGWTDGAVTWSADGIEVTVAAPDAEVVRDGSRVLLRWDVDLPARSAATVGWSAALAEPEPFVVAAPPQAYEEVALTGADLDPRLAPWLARSVADLASLRLALPGEPGDVFYAAGAPWYFTLFGRDSLWAARLTLPLGLDIARGTLRALARLQGRDEDPRTGEQPGKIPHELRRDDLQLGGFTLPPLYYGTVDATPLWICLLHDAWRAGLPDDDVAGLLPGLEAALGWLTAQTGAPGADGFLRYVSAGSQGLANQGWKDSDDAVRFSDGAWAAGAIALCEVQGYAYEAAISGAALLEAFDRPGGEALRTWAADLSERFRARFWCDPTGEGDEAYPALALDGQGRRVDALTSNIGHLVGTGLLNLDEEWRVARHVTSPALDSGLGLRTMAATDVPYAPLSYHCGSVWPHDTAIVVDGLVRAGLGEAAEPLVQGLLAAAEAFDQRLPELWSGEGAPVPYPAACRPQAWSAAAAVVVARRAGVFGG